MTPLLTRMLPAAMLCMSLSAAALADSAPIPQKGATTYLTYDILHVLSINDMSDSGSSDVAEIEGITKNTDGQKVFDNMTEHCLWHRDTVGSKEPFVGTFKVAGSCTSTDGDGDKVFHTFEEGAKEGTTTTLGGTGKYKGISGGATVTSINVPQLGPGHFAFVAEHKITWEIK
jgi:hypothetical protein